MEPTSNPTTVSQYREGRADALSDGKLPSYTTPIRPSIVVDPALWQQFRIRVAGEPLRSPKIQDVMVALIKGYVAGKIEIDWSAQ